MIFSSKKIVLLRLLSLSLFAVLVFTFAACSAKTAAVSGSDAYNYPVKPGTDAWKALGSHADMLNACQIPETTLNRMSTAGLVETVLNYPLFGDAWAWNYPQEGFDSVSSGFNGIPALFDRKDAGSALLSKYKTLDPTAVNSDWTDLQKGQYEYKILDAEMLLAQTPVITGLSTQDCHNLVREAILKYDAGPQDDIIFEETSLWIAARVLEQVKYAPFMEKMSADIDYRNFVAEGSFATDPVLKDIYNQAQGYLSGT
jgi:hypothetical protein